MRQAYTKWLYMKVTPNNTIICVLFFFIAVVKTEQQKKEVTTTISATMTGTILCLFFHLHIFLLLHRLVYVFPICHPLGINCSLDFYEMIPMQHSQVFPSSNYTRFEWIQWQIFYLPLLNGSSWFIVHPFYLKYVRVHGNTLKYKICFFLLFVNSLLLFICS